MADETINMEVNSNIGDVVKDTDKLTKSTKKATISFGGMFNAISKLNIVTKIFDVFKQLLGENQFVVDAMATSMNFLSIAFSDLFKFVESNIGTVTGYFKSLFEDPIGAMEDFARTMIDRVVESFNSLIESIGLATRALIKLFKGDFKGAFDDMKEAGKELVDVVTGVDGSVDKITKTIKTAAGAISEYSKTTFKAAKAQTELDKAVNKTASSLEALNIEFEKQASAQQRIIDNEKNSFVDRKAALEELTRLTEENNAANVKAQELLVKQARINAEKTKTDVDKIKLQEEQNKLDSIKATNLNKLIELKDKEIELNDIYNAQELKDEEELAERKLAIRQQMFNDMQALISSSLEAQGNRIEAEYKKEIKLAEANGKSTEAIEEKYNAKRTALAEKQKKVKIALAMIDMYQSAVAAYNQGLGVPPPAGLALAPIAAGLAVAAGLANINSIMQTDVGVGGGGGGATATAPTTGSPSPQMMSGAFELSGGVEPEAFRAYVVTDEMTNSQNQLANIRRRATI